ncbi:MAG: septation regulator SpoVG [Oscillospiraceae bacterium]
MNITDIKVRKIMNEGKLRGIVSITIDDVLAIHDIKIVQGGERLFAAMPSRRDDSGMYRDIVHPINSQIRADLEDKILTAYKMELDRQSVETQMQ